jgi:hypothetical protein
MSDIPSRNAAALVDKQDETSRTSAPKATEEPSGLPLMQVGSQGIVQHSTRKTGAIGSVRARLGKRILQMQIERLGEGWHGCYTGPEQC